MERVVFQAAQEGNLISLVGSLQEDPLILDRILADSFSETPLHVAAMLGHADVVREIVSRKPQFARELTLNKSSPLHLAAATGFIDVVRALISVDVHMCVASDKDGRNPLHLAAMKGRVDVLKELLQAKPDAARATLRRGETILHLCVTHNQLEAMKFLVETISDQEFLNARNDDGNTILHMSVAVKQVEIINYLLLETSIEVNTANIYGLTAVDILFQSPRDVKDLDIRESLSRVGAVAAKDSIIQPGSQVTRSTKKSKNNLNNFVKQQQDWLERKRNTLMIVASLIATMAFQVGVNPPGGFWQETKLREDPKPAREYYIAGNSVFADMNGVEYGRFMIFSTISFISSLSIILLLISGLPLRRRVFVWILMVIMWVAITAIAATYASAVLNVVWSENRTLDYFIGSVILVWMALVGLLLLWHSIRFVIKSIKALCKFVKKKRLEFINYRNANIVTF